MITATLSIVLDLVVLCFLGVTIYYAIKLTKSLNAFRQARQEFNQVMRELTRNIDDAQRGIEDLKKTSQESGARLQKIINESKMMAEELEVMNQTGARAPLESDEAFRRLEQELLSEVEREDEEVFSIFDKDFTSEEPDAEPEEPPPAGFKSAAERDLYNALQKKRRGAA